MKQLISFESESQDSPLVGDAMTTGGALIPAWLRVGAARRVAALKKVQHLFVEDAQQMVGLLDSQILDGHGAGAAANDNDLVSAHMHRLPKALTPATPATRALETMQKAGVTGLPVVSSRFLIGLVTEKALRRAIDRARFTAPRARSRSGIAGTRLVAARSSLNV